MNVQKEYVSLFYYPAKPKTTESSITHYSPRYTETNRGPYDLYKGTRLDVNLIAEGNTTTLISDPVISLIPRTDRVTVDFSSEILPVRLDSRRVGSEESIEGLMVSLNKFALTPATTADLTRIADRHYGGYRDIESSRKLFKEDLVDFGCQLVFIPERECLKLKNVSPNVFNDPSKTLSLEEFHKVAVLNKLGITNHRAAYHYDTTAWRREKSQTLDEFLSAEFSRWMEDTSYPIFLEIFTDDVSETKNLYDLSHDLPLKRLDYTTVKNTILNRTGLFGDGESPESNFLLFKKMCCPRYGYVNQRYQPSIEYHYRTLGYDKIPASVIDARDHYSVPLLKSAHDSAFLHPRLRSTIPKYYFGHFIETIGCVLKDDVYDALRNNTASEETLSAVQDLIVCNQLRYIMARNGTLSAVDICNLVSREGYDDSGVATSVADRRYTNATFDYNRNLFPRSLLRLIIGGVDRYESMLSILGNIPNTLFTNLEVDKDASYAHIAEKRPTNLSPAHRGLDPTILLQNPLFFSIYPESVNLVEPSNLIQQELDIYNELGWDTIDRELSTTMHRSPPRQMASKPSCVFIGDVSGSVASSYSISSFCADIAYSFSVVNRKNIPLEDISFPEDYSEHALSFLEEYVRVRDWIYSNRLLFVDSRKSLARSQKTLEKIAGRDVDKQLPFLIPYASKFGFLMV